MKRVAAENLRNFKDPGQKCRNIELCNIDATQYQPPDGDFVFYLFAPFPANLMQQVVENVQRAFEASQREIVIVYYNCEYTHLFDAVPFLTQVRHEEPRPGIHSLAIYRSKISDSAAA